MTFSIFQTNTLSDLLNGVGIRINQRVIDFCGTSSSDSTYSPGAITKLQPLASWQQLLAIAYQRKSENTLSSGAYSQLFTVGANFCPCLANNNTADFTQAYDKRFGFIKQVALAAHQQFTWGGNLSKFLFSFNQFASGSEVKNKVITSFVNSMQHMSGTFAGNNDLITSDLTAVNASLVMFGQDLVASGRVIELSDIGVFGLPSVLLKTLKRNNAITEPLAVALMSQGLDEDQIEGILENEPVSVLQERQILAAFRMISTREELIGILVQLNCQTKGIVRLSDLLDLTKLFPLSYQSLMFPDYDNPPTGTFCRRSVPIFTNGTTNNVVVSRAPGSYLYSIFDDIFQCESLGAFAYSMQQVKNIESMEIEKLAQVVSSLETVSDLSLYATPSDRPAINPAIPQQLANIAIGSGESGTILCADGFGAMSGINYNYEKLVELLKTLNTSQLNAKYLQIVSSLSDPLVSPAVNYDSVLQDGLSEVDQLIRQIVSTQRATVFELNKVWIALNQQLQREYSVRSQILNINPSDLPVTDLDAIAFTAALDSYSKRTAAGQEATVLERIVNLSTYGGQGIIASMREARNQERLSLAGGELDTEVSEALQSELGSFDGDYIPPSVIVDNVAITKITGNPTVDTLTAAQTALAVSADPEFLGSLGGSEHTKLLGRNLDVFSATNAVTKNTVSPTKGLDDTVRCNCDF